MKKYQQEAQLRIVLHHKERHALLCSASMVDWDVYFSGGWKNANNLWRPSYHESGYTHIKVVPDREHRIGISEGKSLTFLDGSQNILDIYVATKNLTWDYKIKPDSAVRRTRVIDIVADLRPHFCIEAWAVEPHRMDCLSAIKHGLEKDGKIISSVFSDWTTPWIFMFARTPKKWISDEVKKDLSNTEQRKRDKVVPKKYLK